MKQQASTGRLRSLSEESLYVLSEEIRIAVRAAMGEFGVYKPSVMCTSPTDCKVDVEVKGLTPRGEEMQDEAVSADNAKALDPELQAALENNWANLTEISEAVLGTGPSEDTLEALTLNILNSPNFSASVNDAIGMNFTMSEVSYEEFEYVEPSLVPAPPAAPSAPPIPSYPPWSPIEAPPPASPELEASCEDLLAGWEHGDPQCCKNRLEELSTKPGFEDRTCRSVKDEYKSKSCCDDRRK